MNGSEKTIFNAIKENGERIVNIHEIITSVKIGFMEVRTREKEHHIENIKKFDTLFKKLENVKDNDDLRQEINRLQWIVFFVVVLGIYMKLGV